MNTVMFVKFLYLILSLKYKILNLGFVFFFCNTLYIQSESHFYHMLQSPFIVFVTQLVTGSLYLLQVYLILVKIELVLVKTELVFVKIEFVLVKIELVLVKLDLIIVKIKLVLVKIELIIVLLKQ